VSRRSGLIIVMVALLAAAALALPDGPAISGRDDPRIVIPQLPLAFYVLLAALLFMGIVASISVGFERRERPRRSQGLRFLAILLVAIALWAVFPPLQEGVSRLIDAIDFNDGNGEVSQSDGEAGEGNQPLANDRSEALGAVLTILLAIIVLGFGAALFWLFSSQRTPEEDADAIPLRESMDAGRIDLESIVDPREAVLACYAQMRRAAVSAGTELDDSDTPVETLARLLQRHRVSKSSSTRLTELFQKARFSPHQIDESMRREALEALEEVRAEMMEGVG
jgi:hypothetical protein